MYSLSKQDLYDILYGCTILGTGGGGDLKEGLSLMDKALDAGKEFILADLGEIPGDALIATPYMCGSISPDSEEEESKYATLPKIPEHPALRAFRAMEDYLGQDFYGVISTELGGGNTAVAFYVAALLDKRIVDADPAGRSVPELQHSTYYVHGLPICPMAVANEFGDVAILKEVVDDFRAEALVRAMAVASKNSIAVVDHPATAGRLRGAVIPGAVSYALKIGQTLREARDSGKDPATEVARIGGGVPLFRGRVQEIHWETRDGFTLGETIIEGKGDYSGSSYRIWFKNENIISWLDDRIHVTVPDLICLLDIDTGEPVSNPNQRIGEEVAVFGLPAPAEWRTPEGLRVFGPGHFGYDTEYIPLEKIFNR